MAMQKGKSRKHGQESKHKRTHKVKQDYDYDYELRRVAIAMRVINAIQYSALTERNSKAYKECVIG